MRIGIALTVLTAFMLLVPAGAVAAGGDITYTCSPGPSCSGWFRAPTVTASFKLTANLGNSITNPSGCVDFVVSTDNSDAAQTCSATFTDSGGGSSTISST